MASASSGRQDMLAGVLTETRNRVKQLNVQVERLADQQEIGHRDARGWRNITDRRLDRVEEDILDINSGITKLNSKYDGLRKEVNGLNTKYERLDSKVDGLDKKVDGLDKKVDVLDKKVGVLTDDVGGLKAGQIELRDMVATLLARSEGAGNQN